MDNYFMPGMGYQMPYQRPMYNQPTSNLEWIRVSSLDEIKNVTVNPGCEAWIMCSNDPIFAHKTADRMGMATVDVYRFEPYAPHNKPQDVQYMTRDDVVSIVNEMLGGKSNA